MHLVNLVSAFQYHGELQLEHKEDMGSSGEIQRLIVMEKTREMIQLREEGCSNSLPSSHRRAVLKTEKAEEMLWLV